MTEKRRKISMKRVGILSLTVLLCAAMLLGGCTNDSGQSIELDPENPVTISIWHYYNGALMNAFEKMVNDFNETVGADMGIIVESYGMGSINELESSVISSAKKEVGSMDMPDIFASYADTAYEAEKMDLLANLDDYFTEQELGEYLDSYIEEGRIGINGELRIFPIAKSTEILLVNETDWTPFAEASDITYGDLGTFEDLVKVSEAYYHWTDSLTPDVPNDGKAFFGRDSMANFFIIASKQFGTEIFNVEGGKATVDINEQVMKNLWDYYYVPYVSGYFYAYGKYRSDDAKVGDILAYVGSTSSASYFPNEVTLEGSAYPVNAKVLAAPCFKDASNVMVQQGAGMVVTKSTPQSEYASTVFLKWFTEMDNNIEFSALSGYMPVKKEAVDYDVYMTKVGESNHSIGEITGETIKIAFEGIKTGELYTNKAFDGGVGARAVLDNSLQNKAVSDREIVKKMLADGSTLQEAVASVNTEENYLSWFNSFTRELNDAAK